MSLLSALLFLRGEAEYQRAGALIGEYEEAVRNLEEQIANRAGIDRSEVIVDIQPKQMLLSSMKIGKTDVSILDNGRVRSLASISPLARSLQARAPFDWALLVSAPKGMEEAVGKAAKNVVGISL